jgi:hypothetical protein
LEFHQGKVVRITVDSYEDSADEIDSDLRKWAAFAYDGLKTKYGKPSKVFVPLSKVNIFSFRSHYNVPFIQWIKKGEEISIAGGSQGFKYNMTIIFENLAGVKALKKASTSQRESGF